MAPAWSISATPAAPRVPTVFQYGIALIAVESADQPTGGSGNCEKLRSAQPEIVSAGGLVRLNSREEIVDIGDNPRLRGMPDRHSAAILVIPLRSLTAGKNRLRDCLSGRERSLLIRTMANVVAKAAGNLEVLVMHDDPAVVDWAGELGARSFRPKEAGLNPGLEQVRDILRSEGAARMIVAHADLPFAHDFSSFVSLPGIVIAPDVSRNGTNVFSLPCHASLPFSLSLIHI